MNTFPGMRSTATSGAFPPNQSLQACLDQPAADSLHPAMPQAVPQQPRPLTPIRAGNSRIAFASSGQGAARRAMGYPVLLPFPCYRNAAAQPRPTAASSRIHLASAYRPASLPPVATGNPPAGPARLYIWRAFSWPPFMCTPSLPPYRHFGYGYSRVDDPRQSAAANQPPRQPAGKPSDEFLIGLRPVRTARPANG